MRARPARSGHHLRPRWFAQRADLARWRQRHGRPRAAGWSARSLIAARVPKCPFCHLRARSCL